MLPVQDKVIAEVDALGKDWAPSLEDLEEKLPYLDACLKEALRLYPPAHLLFRETESDMTLEGRPHCLKSLAIFPWLMMRRIEAAQS